MRDKGSIAIIPIKGTITAEGSYFGLLSTSRDITRAIEYVERKKKIKVIYDGYVFQLYAQYHCLSEMGYDIKSMKLYSMDDNKNHPVPLPDESSMWQEKFEKTLDKMRNFNLKNPFYPNINKCNRCIYNGLCDASLC